MPRDTCRWGILGTAVIARKNWKAIRNSGNAEITAVASRDLARSEAFIQECQSHTPLPYHPAALGSYQELIERSDVDAVYIPLPTGLRKEWVIRAANAGKHVLCEKPCAIDADNLHEMIDACKKHHVQFMDGVMYMHSQRLVALREVLNDQDSIGDLKRITCQFSFCAPDEFLNSNIRVNSELEPQGCVGDLGWYTIRFALWVMQRQMPVQVTGRILSEHHHPSSPNAVPFEFSAEMLFDGGVSANFYCSFRTNHQQFAHVSGSKGNLLVSDFVLPYFGNRLSFVVNKASFELFGCDFVMEKNLQEISVPEYGNSAEFAQETNMFRRFSEIVCSGQLDPVWSDYALKTQKIMDACLESARNGSTPVKLG
jgi:predicted dehydrogenase